MINDRVQKQEAGDGSTNLQGQSIVIHQGISYADAREIALDVYKANFIQLSQEAADLARQRATELTDDFLQKLKADNESAVASMSTPGMQAAIYEAQKQYAKTGDKNLEGLLVDILVERAATSERNIKQIVLDESLSVASKLTIEQMDALSINFLIVKTINTNLINLEILRTHIETEITPFLGGLTEKLSCYEHLEYVGCGSIIHVGSLLSIERFFLNSYSGLFSKGFSEERFKNETGLTEEFRKLTTRCLHNSESYQFNGVYTSTIEDMCKTHEISEEAKSKIIALHNATTMSEPEAKEYLLGVCPQLNRLFSLWSNSSISKFSLTTVGVAIAQANFRRRTGIKLNLETWVS